MALHDYRDINLEPEILSYIIEHGLYRERSDNELKQQKQRFVDQFYSYVGRIYAPYEPPPFDPYASEASWKERFYKWIYLENTE